MQSSIGRVRTGPGNPGKSLNLKRKNPGLESPVILLRVLESPGILNSVKKDYRNAVLLDLIVKTNHLVFILSSM